MEQAADRLDQQVQDKKSEKVFKMNAGEQKEG
jgi:hypothetical protein